MQGKPLTTDPEQRANDTRASRYQSGLPPEPPQPQQPPQETDEKRESGTGGKQEERESGKDSQQVGAPVS